MMRIQVLAAEQNVYHMNCFEGKALQICMDSKSFKTFERLLIIAVLEESVSFWFGSYSNFFKIVSYLRGGVYLGYTICERVSGRLGSQALW